MYTKHGAFGQHHFEKRKRTIRCPVRPISGGLPQPSRDTMRIMPDGIRFYTYRETCLGTMRKNTAVCSMQYKNGPCLHFSDKMLPGHIDTIRGLLQVIP